MPSRAQPPSDGDPSGHYAGPYADLHRHGESNAWLDPLVAPLEGREPFDWPAWRESLAKLPPGLLRLAGLQAPMPKDVRNDYLDEPRFYSPVLEGCIRSAADKSILAEIRVGGGAVLQEQFADRFRAAAARVRVDHPAFVPVLTISFWPTRRDGQEQLEALLTAGTSEFAAIDLLPFPYEEEVDWSGAHRAAEQLSAAGFGITIHAGEFTPIHLAPALECPGVTRIGHGTQLREEPTLLQQVVDRGIVIEVCLTSNVLLGAVESLEAHPLRQFLDAGARVVISTDNPARFGTTIAEEYELAASLNLTADDLAACTRTGIEASFCSPGDKQRLLDYFERPSLPTEARP